MMVQQFPYFCPASRAEGCIRLLQRILETFSTSAGRCVDSLLRKVPGKETDQVWERAQIGEIYVI